MDGSAIRITRKVKIDGKWIFAAVPLDKSGRPDAKHVVHKGNMLAVDGGTFYIDHGHGAGRKRISCGSDPDAVKRAVKTQTHVLELRGRGMDVGDAPEIVESRRADGDSLAAIARAFSAEPPTSYTTKTIKKYENALRSFRDWAAVQGITAAPQVNAQAIKRWIAHMQRSERLDASTIVPKVRIVLGELKRHGRAIELESRSMPTIVERERDIYSTEELQALFQACTPDEYELFQTFLLTGMRFREVAFLRWKDIDTQRNTIRVSRKRELGFAPKAYHERTIPVPSSLVALLQERARRNEADGSGLVFPTSTAWKKRGSEGGKADRKMLDKLKQIGRRADLNCGTCSGSQKGNKVTCRTQPICKRWGLHKFRHTYATMMLRDKVDIVTVSKWLGHKDLATTRIYLRALEAEVAQPQVEQSTLAMAFAGHNPKFRSQKLLWGAR